MVCFQYLIIILHGVACVKKIQDSFVQRRNLRIQNEEIESEQSARSDFRCLMYCVKNKECDKASWSLSLKKCLLALVTGGVHNEPFNVVAIYHSKLQPEDNWVTYERQFSRVSLYNVGYSMDFYDEAAVTCIAMGTTIASVDTVLQNRNVGTYTNCGCGYVSEGLEGISKQANDTFCYDDATLGLLFCTLNFNGLVYCNVP